MADNGAIEQLTVRTLTHVVGNDGAGRAGRQPTNTLVPTSRQVVGGRGMRGGGQLSGDVTIELSDASVASLDKADTSLQPEDVGATIATAAQGNLADTAAQETTIGSFSLVKNRADFQWDVQDFVGATFTDKLSDALQNTMENDLKLRSPSGENVLEDIVTIDGTTATRRVSFHGDSPLASRIRVNGGKIIINLTAWGQIDINNLWLDPVGNQVGDAPLQINWSGMVSSRGFRIRNTHIGPTNAADNVSNWFDNALKINGKGSGLIDGLWICGKSADAPLGNGIQIDNAKDVVIAHTVMYHLQKGLFSTDDGSSISEGIKFVHGTMVNMDYGIYMVDSVGLPNFELIGSHIAYNRRGVYLKGWTQNKLIDNLIYAENNSLETTQEDIYLDTCPATVVSRNQFFSGLDKATVPKIGLTLIGSSRNSRYEHNLFSQRSLAIKLVDNGSSGIQDCVFENNRPERDLSGNPTVTSMLEISNSALHTRNRWIGEETEFSSSMTTAANTDLASATWTTIPFGAVTATTPALAVTASATTGEYTIPQNGITRGRIKAKARITTASAADAGSIGLRLMRNNGSGFVELERVSGGGTDTALYLESREYAFAAGNSFRIEAYCSATGTATIILGAYLEFYPVK